MRRVVEQRKAIYAWTAIVMSVAFFWAMNYCNVEAFTAHSPDSQTSDQTAPAERHDGDSPAPNHRNEAVMCCTAIQAIMASRFEFQLSSSATWQLHPLVPQSLWLVSLLEPSRTTSGLSPPTREPTPAGPFYRTTFASHAPPAYLA